LSFKSRDEKGWIYLSKNHYYKIANYSNFFTRAIDEGIFAYGGKINFSTAIKANKSNFSIIFRLKILFFLHQLHSLMNPNKIQI
jgi:hypothetical protein